MRPSKLVLPADPADEELARDWTLSEADKAEVRRCRGDTRQVSPLPVASTPGVRLTRSPPPGGVHSAERGHRITSRGLGPAAAIGARLARCASTSSAGRLPLAEERILIMPEQNRRLWLIDAAYMFLGQQTVGTGFQFDYKKLRDHLERDGKFFQAYYVNSTPNPPTDQQDAFHTWLKSAPPRGPRHCAPSAMRHAHRRNRPARAGRTTRPPNHG